MGYAKCLGAEVQCFSKLHVFNYTVHVNPFVRPPSGSTNDPDLISNLVHISTWLEKVQRWNLQPLLQHDPSVHDFLRPPGGPSPPLRLPEKLPPPHGRRWRRPPQLPLLGAGSAPIGTALSLLQFLYCNLV